MASRKNRGIFASSAVGLSTIWAVYSNFTTARDLPADASWVAKMLADPPIYLPWLLLAISIVLLAWFFWDRPKGDDRDSSSFVNQWSRGSNSPNVSGNFHGPVTFQASDRTEKKSFRKMVHPVPTVPREKKRPDMSFDELCEYLTRNLPWPKHVNSQQEAFEWLERHIMDKMAMDDMAVWGRLGHSALQEMHLMASGTFSLNWNEGVLIRHPYGEKPIWGERYNDLHFYSGDVKRIWPNGKARD